MCVCLRVCSSVCACVADNADYCSMQSACVCVWGLFSLTVFYDGRDENSEGAVISPALKLRKVQEAHSFNLTFIHLIF